MAGLRLFAAACVGLLAALAGPGRAAYLDEDAAAIPVRAFSGEARFVPYIQCEACDWVVKSLAELVRLLPRRPDEERIEQLIGGVCRTRTSTGRWMQFLDILPTEVQGETFLVLKEQWDLDPKAGKGACRQECETIALACRRALDDFLDEEELIVKLWRGDLLDKVSNKHVVKGRRHPLCDAACEGFPVALSADDRARFEDRPFEELSPEDAALEDRAEAFGGDWEQVLRALEEEGVGARGAML